MQDLISRQAAIDLFPNDDLEWDTKGGYIAPHLARQMICELPPAQPETHEKRTETHACDLIDRQTAIDAILAVTGNSSVRELYEHVQEHGLSDMWSGGVNAAIDIIIALPSVQPDMSEYSDKLWKAAYERGKEEAQQRWIPCNERLPEKPEQVLIYAWNVHYVLAKYKEIRTREGIYKMAWVVEDAYNAPHEIKHEVICWMPLPEPYREDSE